MHHAFYSSLEECFIFAARLDGGSATSLTLALFVWQCLFGNGDSAVWEETAFVRMPGVPWIRSYCHLLLLKRGREG